MTSLLLNSIYLVALIVGLPWLVLRSLRTGRYRRGINAKLFGTRSIPSDSRQIIWFHAVSVGEVHLLRQVIRDFRERHPDWRVVVSSTTDSGLAEAKKHFADLTITAYPFDFSWAVRRTIRAISPKLIVLAESELWPNFLRAADRALAPVVVINGRMSPRTYRRYAKVARLARWLMFDRVSMFSMQSETYANHLRSLGVPSERVEVTGSVKYDGVAGDRADAKTIAIGKQLGIASEDLVWVAGSTHDPEERIVLAVYGRLKSRYPALRLILVPRAPERFDEVARLIEAAGYSCAQRSQMIDDNRLDNASVLLIDTLGELSAVWGLATIGFTGGSLNEKRGGQSMIEPAGLGVPVLFGPHTWNFRDAVAGLLEVGGAIEIHDEAELERDAARLLGDGNLRSHMGEAAKSFVRAQQGATARALDMLDRVIASEAA